ncbi:MAG: protein-L-isoaspartate(D-aspartate) O-methyltransferase [Bacteriovoracaceae bacterium]|nr:protein-L-isoaspartate(D-aspartate) O-methyltransferase [Bacteriovoracaceae bacterium]
MIKSQIIARGISNPQVIKALEKIPRHLFVPPKLREQAYGDYPLPIGHGQTISQPYIVAYMTQKAGLKPTDRVLEIGTGSGYQAAILSQIVKEVYSIEILKELSMSAKIVIDELKLSNIHLKVGDGYLGWSEHAPFDAIVVTAAPSKIPAPLIEQLKMGGRLIIPVGDFHQELVLLTKTKNGMEKKTLLPVRFVPMTGKAQQK